MAIDAKAIYLQTTVALTLHPILIQVEGCRVITDKKNHINAYSEESGFVMYFDAWNSSESLTMVTKH